MTARLRLGSLDAWLEWQQTLHPRAMDLGLERVARVLERTGWRPPRVPVLTVGGTNGKGSCVATIAALLAAGGYRVATFTSPHLVDYRERIRVDGVPVSAASLVAAFERIADALGADTLTFFEFNTLAALLVFESACPDAVVLEVGMGGRLDAVNVVDPDVAVIVSVGLDHMEWLGPDVESIGREKAGILRAGRPAVVGTPAPPRSVIEVANAIGADLRLRGRDFDASAREAGRWDYRDRDGRLDSLPEPGLTGVVQVDNAATALAALRALGPRLPLARPAVERGLAQVRLAGRFQRLQDAGGVEWVLDVAHNEDSARTLAANLRRWPAAGRTLAVCGMLADKDARQVAGLLGGVVDRWYAASTDGPRGLAAEELSARAAGAGVTMVPAGRVEAALTVAAAAARPGDRVVVFGSFHTVGPALRHLAAIGRAPPSAWL